MTKKVENYLKHIDKLMEPYRLLDWKEMGRRTDLTADDCDIAWVEKYYLARSESLYWMSMALVEEFQQTTYDLMILIADEITYAIDEADNLGKPLDLQVFRWVSKMYKNVLKLYKQGVVK